MEHILIWDWDYKKNLLFASSKYHDGGSSFWYYIKQKPVGFELSGTPELIPKPKRFHKLAGAIRAANRIENS